MIKEEFLLRLHNMEKALHITPNDYGVLCGGSLLLRGIREETRDIDLVFKPEVAARINLDQFPTNDRGLAIVDEYTEGSDNWSEWKFELIDGVQCQTLDDIIRCKVEWGRDKDIKDLKEIRPYMS